MNPTELAKRLDSIEDSEALGTLSNDEQTLALALAVKALSGTEHEIPAWVMRVAGAFGDDQTAHLMADFVVKVSAEVKQTPVFQQCVDALRSMGTPASLLQIQHAASHAMSPDLMNATLSALREVSEEKGMRVWELEDEIVPNCGLEIGTATTFSIGADRYVLGLDDELQPVLHHAETRARHRVLPAGAPPAERERWNLITANLEDTVPYQRWRLEQALTAQMRWQADRWQQNLLVHPLMIHLAQRLVWATYSKAGRIKETFRVDETHALVDADDEPFLMPEGRLVGVAHPQEMGPDLVGRWGEVMGDYGVSTICPQLDRPKLGVADAVRKHSSIAFGESIPAAMAFPFFIRRGWLRGRADRVWGWDKQFTKTFRSADTVAHFRYEEDGNAITIGQLQFRRFLSYPQSDFQLRDVHPIVLSEVLRDLEEALMPELRREMSISPSGRYRPRLDSQGKAQS